MGPTKGQGRPARGQASLAWQAALILLPVVLLACLGLVSLRQDRRAVEQEAREQAEFHADRLAATLAGEFVGNVGRVRAAWLAWREAVLRDADGLDSGPPGGSRPGAEVLAGWDRDHPGLRLQDLPAPDARVTGGEGGSFPRSDLPAPPGWLTELSSASERLWREAETAAAAGQTNEARARWREFVAGRPAAEAVLNAEFRLLCAPDAPRDQAGKDLLELAIRAGKARSPAGLLLANLALCQALDRLPPAQTRKAVAAFAAHGLPWREELADDSLPSVLELEVLSRAARAAGTDAQLGGVLEGLRELHRCAQQAAAALRVLPGDPATPGSARICLFEVAGQPGQARKARLVPASVLEWAAAEAVRSAVRPGLPAYLGARVSVSGSASSVAHATGPGLADGPARRRQLAWRSVPFSLVPGASADAGAGGVLGLAVELARPELLYARHQRRVWSFAGFTLAATAAALAGLAAAWRAFGRQLRLNEMKSNFVSSVSHELRAPIASVRLLAESLARGKIAEEPRRQEYFRLIGQECRRLSSLIENVLDFSRIDQGRKQYEFEPTDLRALAVQTVALMEPYAAEKTVRLALAPADGPAASGTPESAASPAPGGLLGEPAGAGFLLADGRAVQQALVNLIDNAIKHSPTGERVEVRLELVPGRDSTPAALRLSVADRGPGIPKAEQERIFEPFCRRGSELRRETPGIGIGLSIVKHVVQAHQGRVWVESEVGRGSRFVLEFPVREPERPSPASCDHDHA